MRIHWLFGMALVIVTLRPLLTGLKLFITKKPFVYPARMDFLVIMISVSPLFIPTLSEELKKALNDGSHPGIYFFILLYGGASFYFWRGTRGYVVVGVTEESLRESLKCVLKKLNLDFKEMPAGFQLTTDNTNLRLKIQRWSGTVRLELKGAKDTFLLKEVAKSLGEYFVLSPPRVNFRAGAFDITTSLVLIALIAVYVARARIFM